jgi:diguanylate cyclase (GGDEF)-like protein
MAPRASVTTGKRPGQRLLIMLIGALMVGLLAGFAAFIHRNEIESRQALSDRFETRAALTASFAQNFVNDLAARERTQAERLLAGPEVDQASFENVVRSFDFEAAVLLDQDGHLLQVWPAKPELIGRDMTVQYQHLRTAVAGQVGVSEMVPSAAKGIPITAVAVPYQSVSGRRVFSGAFSPATTPLGAYLSSVVPIAGGSAYLADRSGHVLAASNMAGSAGEDFAGFAAGVTELHLSTGPTTVAVAETPAIPWRVVLTAPSDGLYAPVAVGRWAPWAMWLALAASGAVVLLLFVRLGHARTQAAATARTDVLTGLPNRRAMQELLNQAAALSRRHHVPFAALSIDIDGFKNINDTHGHDIGDLVISATASALTEATREEDLAGRWGGEEFLVLLPHTDADAALIAAERIRATIANTSIPECPEQLITVSIGVGLLRRDDTAVLLRDADTALYAAKANGRNRVEAFAAPLDNAVDQELTAASMN